MTDFAELRRTMVDNQIRPSSVTNHHLISTLQAIPREEFLPSAMRPLAYSDMSLRLDTDGDTERFLLAPVVLARMIQALDLTADQVVLDIACATGYSSAVLAELAGSVVAVDNDASLVGRAETVLANLAIDNVAVLQEDLTSGYAAEAPYDAVFIGGAISVLPDSLKNQLAPGGRLVCVMSNDRFGRAMLFERSGSDVTGRPLFDAVAPLLPGFERKPVFEF